jgi:REP element-mobilizing transposase RayT
VGLLINFNVKVLKDGIRRVVNDFPDSPRAGADSAVNKYHIFISFLSKYSISKVVGILKAVSAREIRKEFPRVELWGGEFWEDGYFARRVGDEVTAEVIKEYIRFHEQRAK